MSEIEHSAPPVIACGYCGSADGVVQHVDLAWSGDSQPAHWAGLLHADCERAQIRRLEYQRRQHEQGKPTR